MSSGKRRWPNDTERDEPQPKRPQYKIGYTRLLNISKCDPREAVMSCSEANFLSLLSDERGKDWIDLILTSINLSLNVDSSLRDIRDHLTSNLLNDHLDFFTERCISRIEDGLGVSTSGSNLTEPLLKTLQCYLQIYHSLCSVDPLANKKLLRSVELVYLKLKEKPSEKTSSLIAEYGNAVQAVKEKERAKNDNAKTSRGDRECISARPAEDYRNLKPYPTIEDVNGVDKVKLRKNKQTKGFEDADDYLDLQYRLLREDFVSSVREGVKTVQKKSGFVRRGELKTGAGNFKVYNNFRIEGLDMSNKGLFHILRVDINHSAFRSEGWLKSKRLIYGSLICLSTSYFKHDVLFATIADRARPDRRTPEANKGKDIWQTLKIKFLPESLTLYMDMSCPKGPFVVVESSAFYEAYNHVLNGLMTFTEHNLPLQDYIVFCKNEISVPVYLEDGELFYRLPIGNSCTDPLSMSDTESWPSAESLQFNSSQYKAFKAALTQEFAVIQGPPGTGKTYVGLKIVETLLGNLFNAGPCRDPVFWRRKTPLNRERNKVITNECDSSQQACNSPSGVSNHDPNEEEDTKEQPALMTRPMLVVCYTNHALDQFLEGILDFNLTEGDLIRVGSRSKSEKLAPCNLHNFARKMQSVMPQWKFSSIINQKENIKAQCQKLMKKSRKLLSSDDVHAWFIELIDDQQILQVLWDAWDWLSNGNPAEVEDETNKFLDWRNSRTGLTKRLNTAKLSASTNHPTGNADNAAYLEEDDDETEKRTIDETEQQDQDNVTMDISMIQDSDWILDKSVMSETEVDAIMNEFYAGQVEVLHELSLADRWRLCRYWFRNLQMKVTAELLLKQKEFDVVLAMEQNLRQQNDIEVLKRAKVVGMTTTAAARLQSVLQAVQPQIVIVEEAAEVLEAHIITALSTHCKHLILIGDHKQLKPNPAVYVLAKDYHLDLSLFERMVNNGLPVSTLDVQHRMRPEVSKYIRGNIYDNLYDHHTVRDLEPIRGVQKPVFFFNHSKPETENVGLMSKCNEFEADMIVQFSRYLSRQGYGAEQLTVITMYKGQELMIRQKMRGQPEFENLRVSSVDNFQGEENDIILISLVRSNDKDKLGFIDIENRVCVTMSRAKYGMYVFGNFDMIANKSDIWGKIIQEAKEVGEYGKEINLSCVRHRAPNTACCPDDFEKKVPLGGCIQLCNDELDCGHRCPMKCHYTDMYHEKFSCNEACTRKCIRSHPCKDKCGFSCSKCKHDVTGQLEKCSHTATAPCHMWDQPEKIYCKEPCSKNFDCGHQCTKCCSEECGPSCLKKVEKMCSRCQNTQEAACYLDINQFMCDTPCDATLDCGHNCEGTCFICNNSGEPVHKKCQSLREKVLPCGHKCKVICSNNEDSGRCSNICMEKCSLKCSHGSKCSERCYEECKFDEGKRRCTWICKKHDRCTKDCGRACNFRLHDKPCVHIVLCDACSSSEKCRGICGQICPKMCKNCTLTKIEEHIKMLPEPSPAIDSTTRWLRLEDCYDIVPVSYMDQWVESHKEKLPIHCPFTDCNKLVLNTGRYIRITRSYKFKGEVVEPRKHSNSSKCDRLSKTSNRRRFIHSNSEDEVDDLRKKIKHQRQEGRNQDNTGSGWRMDDDGGEQHQGNSSQSTRYSSRRQDRPHFSQGQSGSHNRDDVAYSEDPEILDEGICLVRW